MVLGKYLTIYFIKEIFHIFSYIFSHSLYHIARRMLNSEPSKGPKQLGFEMSTTAQVVNMKIFEQPSRNSLEAHCTRNPTAFYKITVHVLLIRDCDFGLVMKIS